MLPKEFIQQVLINELGEIHSQHPYIAFATMAIGVEFLGKCLNDHDDWNFYAAGIHKQDFKSACEEVMAMTSFPSNKMDLPLCAVSK